MTTHIFGMILTHQGTFSNNRGEGEGTTNTLQKVIREGELYSTVSAEAIRYALREGWQKDKPENLNRRTLSHEKVKYEDGEFWAWSGQERLELIKKELSQKKKALSNEEDPEKKETQGKEIEKQEKELEEKFEQYANEKYLDDDVLGFMHAQEKTVSRRGNLEVTRAISTTPWAGEIMQNFASPGSNPIGNGNDNPIPYAVEVHHTRYQFGFALTPDALGRERNCDDQGNPMNSSHNAEERRRRVQATLDGLCNLRRVGGAHARYFSDYSPEAFILRITDDPAPRMLYCFRQTDTGELSIRELINKVEAGDITASELVIGTTLDIAELRGVETNGDGDEAGQNGSNAKDRVTEGPLKDAHLVKGVKRAVELCMKRISPQQGGQN